MELTESILKNDVIYLIKHYMNIFATACRNLSMNDASRISQDEMRDILSGILIEVSVDMKDYVAKLKQGMPLNK